MNRKQHQLISNLFLGYDIPSIHFILDSSSQLVGGKHRNHSHTLGNLRMIDYFYGKRGFDVALLHYIADGLI